MEIDKFIDWLHQIGCSPTNTSDIRETETIRRYDVVGDKRKSGNGWYWFKDYGAFARGSAGSWKLGVSETYKSNVKQEYSQSQIKEARKRHDADKKLRNREAKQAQEQAAKECAETWAKATPCNAHPYLSKKGIQPHGTRTADLIKNDGGTSKNVLLIPAYKDGKITNIQRIYSNGLKAFWRGGDPVGAYYPIAKKGEDLSTIYLVEGFATGASIREALGVPVVVAFNVGNLEPVLKELIKKYPDSVIINAADNDHYKKRNAGLEKANELLSKHGAPYTMPNFDPEDESTDWNDAGLDNIKLNLYKNIRRGVTPVSVVDNSQENSCDDTAPPLDWLNESPPLEAYDDGVIPIESMQAPQAEKFEYNPDWQSQLIFDDKGNLAKTMSVNASLIIENSDLFRNMFCYDEFSHRKLVVQCPPWEVSKTFKPRNLCDEDVTEIGLYLQHKNLKIQHADLKRCLDAVLRKKRRNPAREYMDSLEWDGKSRLHTWLAYYCGAEKDDPEYLAKAGTMWMVAAVTRIFRPGAKFDHMLILEGRQGARKSTVLKELATIHGNEYFTDSITVDELGTLSGVMKMQGCLIAEFAEMTGLGKANTQKLKQQIALDEDKVRLNYKNEPTSFPRQLVFAGTINPENGYLNDPTGNRRYWPVEVGDKIDVEALAVDKEQLWAEAVYLFKQGQRIYVSEEEKPLFDSAQQDREFIDAWFDKIKASFRGQRFITNTELHAAIDTTTSRWDRRMSNRLAGIMTRLGYSEGRMGYGNRERGWQNDNPL